jgi:hypothetical protein
MMVSLQAEKYRKNQSRRPRFPSISSYHASNSFASQAKSPSSCEGPGFPTTRISMPSAAYVKDIAESRYNMPVTINALMRAFEYPRFRVQVAMARG